MDNSGTPVDPPPGELHACHCPQCGRLLFRFVPTIALYVEIKCRHCAKFVVLRLDKRAIPPLR